MIIPLRILVSLLLLPGIALTQTQIGEDIYVEGDPIGTTLGHSVCLSSDGNVLAVGAPTIDGANGEDTDTGRVTVYKQEGGAWKLYGNAIYGDIAYNLLGNSLGLSSDGSILAIGACRSGGVKGGEVRVYKEEAGTWVQIGETLYGDHSGDGFGNSISLSNDGTILAVGASASSGADEKVPYQGQGQVKIYTQEAGVWQQMGDAIYGEDSFNNFGERVSLSGDGNLLAVGAPGNDGPDGNVFSTGQVKLFSRSILEKTWELREVLYGDNEYDYFGYRISLSNDGTKLAIVVYGSSSKDGLTPLAGQVKIFKKESGVWNWQQLGVAYYGETRTGFLGGGGAVSLSGDGNTLAIGSYNDAEGEEIKVFKDKGGIWQQLGKTIYENNNTLISSDLNIIDLSHDGSVLATRAFVTNSTAREGKIVKVFNIDDSSLDTDDYLVSSSRIYPNPVEDYFYITLEDRLELEKVNLYNETGQLVLSTTSTRVDVSELPSGLYLAELHINKGKVTKKILVN